MWAEYIDETNPLWEPMFQNIEDNRQSAQNEKKENKMKLHRDVTLALILALLIDMPRIIIVITNKEPVYLIIDKIIFICWFIGMWSFFHEKRALGLAVMISTCSIFLVWIILFFKIVSISIFTIVKIFLLICFTSKASVSVWIARKNSYNDKTTTSKKTNLKGK